MLYFLENTTIPSGSKGWVAIFPILFVLILVGLGIRKRKQLKSFYQSKIQKSASKKTSM
jgi:hypothetical protein